MEIKYLVMIIGMTLVTFIPRYLPMALLSRMKIPEIVIRWLRYIPAAMLAALLVPGILLIDGHLTITGNIYLLAALPTFFVAIWKKNIFLTVVVGMVLVILLK
jgi:branched-subunit amino acid transport protein